MTYERFSEIWDAYIPKNIVWDCSNATTQALIEYGQGNTTKVDEIRKFLGRK